MPELLGCPTVCQREELGAWQEIKIPCCCSIIREDCLSRPPDIHTGQECCTISGQSSDDLSSAEDNEDSRAKCSLKTDIRIKQPDKHKQEYQNKKILI